MVRAAWNRGTQNAIGGDRGARPTGIDRGAARDELRGLLGVYADELQQLGDPRGELIALDLLREHRHHADGERGSLDDKVAALVGDWLGAIATHPNIHTRYGLV